MREHLLAGFDFLTCEHISLSVIQASDISHTMQHWHVYRKWNQNLFEEMYVAFLKGRLEKDPSEFWYKGEFGRCRSQIAGPQDVLISQAYLDPAMISLASKQLNSEGFFDFYIIPLTRKLKECGVFGVSSDEYLNYALKNREEWELRGEEVVLEMMEACRRKYGVKEEGCKVGGEDQSRGLETSRRRGIEVEC